MKVINISDKEKQKKELYEMLKSVPHPSGRFNLTTSQKYWWYWFGKEIIKTGKFASLDQIHLQKAAIWMDAKNNVLKEINRRNLLDKNGIDGWVQRFSTGATNITGYVSIIEKADKHLDEISAHFGLSIRDRNKFKEAPNGDPDQMSMFEEFLNQKNA